MKYTIAIFFSLVCFSLALTSASFEENAYLEERLELVKEKSLNEIGMESLAYGEEVSSIQVKLGNRLYAALASSSYEYNKCGIRVKKN